MLCGKGDSHTLYVAAACVGEVLVMHSLPFKQHGTAHSGLGTI